MEPRAKETYGYTETEALGKNVRDIVARLIVKRR